MRSSIIITIFLHLLISCSGGGGTSPDFFGNNGAQDPSNDAGAGGNNSGDTDTGGSANDSSSSPNTGTGTGSEGANPTDSFFRGSGSSSGVILSGISQLGPIKGAIVQARLVDDSGEVSDYCSDSEETGEDGAWDVDLYEECVGEDIMLETIGGKYTDESTGEEVTLTEDDRLEAIVPEVTSEAAAVLNDEGGIGISPLSQIATERIKAVKQPGISFRELKQVAVKELKETLGVHPFVTPAHPENDVGEIDPEDPRAKAMAVIAGFSEMANEICGGECDQISMIKIIAADMRDGKNDGLIGDLSIGDLDNSVIENIGVKGNAIGRIKNKMVAVKTSAEGTGEQTFISKVKNGASTWAEKVKSQLPSEKRGKMDIVVNLKFRPEDNELDLEQEFPDAYKPERDKMNDKYNAIRDPYSDLYVPTIDPYLLGDDYDPKYDPCMDGTDDVNEDGVKDFFDPDGDGNSDYDVAKDPCLNAKEFKKDMMIGGDLDQSDIDDMFNEKINIHFFDEDEDGNLSVKDDFESNFDLFAAKKDDFDLDLDDVHFVDLEIIKEKISYVDALKEDMPNKEDIIDMIRDGENVRELRDSMSGEPGLLEGVWRSKVCERDGKQFIKDVVKFRGDLVIIEANLFSDNMCQRPLDMSNFSKQERKSFIKRGRGNIPEEGVLHYFTKKGDELFLGFSLADKNSLAIGLPVGESEGVSSDAPTIPPSDCVSSPVVGCFERVEVENPFSYDEQEKALEEIDEDIFGVEAILQEYTPVFTKSFLTFDGSNVVYAKRTYIDDSCSVEDTEFVREGSYTSTVDVHDGDLKIDFTSLKDGNGEDLPDYFGKILVMEEGDFHVGLLGDDMFGTRGGSVSERADFFNFANSAKYFERHAGTAVGINDLTGSWETDCVESYDVFTEFIDPEDLENVGNINFEEHIEFRPEGDDSDFNSFGNYDPSSPGEGFIDFSDSSGFLFSSPDNTPHDYSSQTIDSSLDVGDFSGAYLGECYGDVAMIVFSPHEDSGTGSVFYECGEKSIEGEFEIEKLLGDEGEFDGYFKLDIEGEFYSINQTMALLEDGRLVLADDSCVEEESCVRPGVEDVKLDDPYFSNYFYKVDNQVNHELFHGESEKIWSSSCLCRGDSCGEGSLYEKIEIKFSNNDSFEYTRTIYVDYACSVESSVQDDESSATGSYFLVSENVIDLDGEYVLSSKLFLNSDVQLSVNADNCFLSKDTSFYKCEYGDVISIDGQLLIDQGENDEFSYYNEQNDFSSSEDFLDTYQDPEILLDNVFAMETGTGIPPFPSHLSKHVGAIPFNEVSEITTFLGLKEFTILCPSGGYAGGLYLNSDGTVFVACEDFSGDYDLSSDQIGKLHNGVVTMMGVPAPDLFLAKVDGDDSKLFLSTDENLLLSSAATEKLLVVENSDFSLLESGLSNWSSPCLPDSGTQKFIREWFHFGEEDSGNPGNYAVGFNRLLFSDPGCKSPVGVSVQSEGYIELAGLTGESMEYLVFTMDQEINDRCEESTVDPGSYDCDFGHWISAGGFLIPLLDELSSSSTPTISVSSCTTDYDMDSTCSDRFSDPTCISTGCNNTQFYCVNNNKCTNMELGSACMSGMDCLSTICDMYTGVCVDAGSMY